MRAVYATNQNSFLTVVACTVNVAAAVLRMREGSRGGRPVTVPSAPLRNATPGSHWNCGRA